MDDNRYKGLKQALDNEHLKNYVVPGNKKQEEYNNKGEESGVAFAQTHGPRDWTDLVCFECGKKGHPSYNCPTTPTQRKN